MNKSMEIRKVIPLILYLVIFVINVNSKSNFKVVAYFPLYSTIEEAKKTNFSQFTHVNIEAVYSSKEGELEIPSWSGNILKELALIDTIISKGHAANTKILLTVGYSTSTLEMLKDSIAREKFSDTLIQYCKQKHINGIDLDIEGNFDSDGYTKFANLLKKKINSDSLLLSAAVTGSPKYNGQKWSDNFLQAMDYINVMIYDIRGSWNGSPIGNHSSYEDYIIAATEWNKRISKSKIILGTPLYGRTFADDGTMRIWGNNSWSSNTILYKDIVKFFSGTLLTDTTAGEFNHTIGDLNLSENEMASFNINICENWNNAPTLTGNEILGKTFYSGPTLTKEKTKYTLNNSFGGIMILKLSYDTNDSTSLIKTICNEVELNQTNIIPNSKTDSYKIQIFENTTISTPFKRIKVAKLYNVNGRLLLKIKPDNLSCPIFIDKSNHAKGINILKLESFTGQIYTKKIGVETGY